MPELGWAPELLLLMLLVGVAAGWLDSIAGGGGLIALPALLLTGVGPLEALGTNKLQSCVGAGVAATNYTRRGWVDLHWARWLIVASFTGAAAGTWLVQRVDTRFIEWVLPALLGGVALYFLLSPRLGDLESRPRLGRFGYGLTAAPGIGFYDGFFGPGTGSFFTASAVALLGASATRAVALTKLLNFASNVAALTLFLAGGHVVWALGLAMLAGQAIGAWLGSSLAIRHGVGLIRPLVVLVSVTLMLRLLWQQWGG
ncbi:TSUP family transporter [Spiribacter halobius]|uniref:Probable membrane transporter protein n=1 Tax=Sediminicurvatus halobius TaxID=2182432 RepID=A0A2U2MXX4_9GAMM|nr:TSUP family transporter [Spiribacter halobius]PWG61668.1 hypothetical protein DEM34_15450 [Spiribacter halobius]UEX79433.1 TSUP family transporter [Spiribacter halobius]